MDDPLVKLLAAEPLAERLRHKVHEVERPLPVLHGLLALLLALVRFVPDLVKRVHEACDDHNEARDDEEKHGRDAQGNGVTPGSEQKTSAPAQRGSS